MMRTMGVVLVPLCEVMEELVALQRRVLEIEPLTPELGLDRHLPHITLLQGASERELLAQEELSEVAEAFCLAVPSCAVTVTKVQYVAPGWYFLLVDPLDALRNVQTRMLAVCGERMRVTEQALAKDVTSYSQAEQLHFKQYGYRYVGHEFLPHLTLGRTGSREASPRESEILKAVATDWEGRSIPIEQISLCEVGPNGAYEELLATVEL